MATSHRQIIRSSAIVGSASMINIFLGIVRMRIAAYFVGPVGIGLFGLLQTVTMLATSCASLGIGSGGAREIARVGDSDVADKSKTIRQTLWMAGLALALVGTVATWAVLAFGPNALIASDSLRQNAKWIAIAVGLGVVGSVQIGILTGQRRIGDIARVQVMAGVGATLVAMACFPLFGIGAIILLVIVTPLFAALAGSLFLRSKTSKPNRSGFDAGALRSMLGLGLSMTSSLIFSLLGGVAIRLILERFEGAQALGYFQASWTIASMYLGLIFQAMATDYLPRLSARADDDDALRKMVNEQADVLLLIGGPIIIGMIGFAPVVLWILYGPAFVQGSDVLRILLLSDIVRLIAWPLSFVLLAKALTRRFLLIEGVSLLALLGVAWVAVPRLGLAGAGFAYLAMSVVSLLMILQALPTILPSFRLDRPVWSGIIALVLAAAILSLPWPNAFLKTVVGSVLAACLLARSARRIRRHFPEFTLRRLFRRAD